MRGRRVRTCLIGVVVLLGSGFIGTGYGQVSSLPSNHCHVDDGVFTICASGEAEWSDVAPLSFLPTNSYLYVNQDSTHTFLHLMYDLTFRTSRILDQPVIVSFDTVEQNPSGAALEHYNISLFSSGNVEVTVNGLVESPGRIAGSVGFGISPNSNVPHLMAELRVPITPGEGTAYSPDPIFWTVTAPPTVTPPPPPPGQKTQAQKDALVDAADAKRNLGFAIAAGCLFLAPGPSKVACGLLAIAVAAEAAQLNRMARVDPSDPNFTSIVEPAPYALPTQSPGDGFSQLEADGFNAALQNAADTISLEEAIFVTINRAQGARDAGNPFWESNQLAAAQVYEARLAPLVSLEPELWTNVGTALRAAGISFAITQDDIRSFQLSRRQTGFPLSDVQALEQLGFNAADTDDLLQTIIAANPASAAILGTGVFPASLSDPLTRNVFKLAALALSQESTLPHPDVLTESFNATLAGNYVAAGIGLRDRTSGIITIASVPDDAIVEKAFLYWGMLDTGSHANLGQLNFQDVPITGTLLAVGPDTCWGRSNSLTYRADVTPFVTGNGLYALTDVASGGLILAQGASLVLIYSSPTSSFRHIMIADGNIALPIGAASGTALFSGFKAAGPISASTTFMVGDGQAKQFNIFTPVSFTGDRGALSFQGLFAAADGPLWDTATFDVASVIGLADASGVARIQVSGDCLLWSGQVFSVSSAPIVRAPVVATAAVVKTSAGGDTSVGSRGLTESDVPTIQDRVEMIVINRAIEGRATSAIELATQLVNSLPSSTLPPGEAANVVQNILRDVISIDATPPVIIGLPSPNCIVSRSRDHRDSDEGDGLDEFVPIAHVTARDSLSGVLPGSLVVTAASNQPVHDVDEPQVKVVPDGADGFLVQVRPKSSSKDLRIYTVTARVSDVAGNVATGFGTCTVSKNEAHK